MPSGPRYERVPLEEESLPANNYFTGLPSTAPPSFRTIPLDQQSFTPSLPHRNDESAATIMPRSERPDPETDDAPISLWGASESTTTRDRDVISTREDVLVRLLDVVERLEGRLDARDAAVIKEEIDLEALTKDIEQKAKKDQRHTRTNEILGYIGTFFIVIVFLIWLGAIIIVPAVARYKYAGAIAAAAAAAIPTANLA